MVSVFISVFHMHKQYGYSIVCLYENSYLSSKFCNLINCRDYIWIHTWQESLKPCQQLCEAATQPCFELNANGSMPACSQ